MSFEEEYFNAFKEIIDLTMQHFEESLRKNQEEDEKFKQEVARQKEKIEELQKRNGRYGQYGQYGQYSEDE